MGKEEILKVQKELKDKNAHMLYAVTYMEYSGVQVLCEISGVKLNPQYSDYGVHKLPEEIREKVKKDIQDYAKRTHLDFEISDEDCLLRELIEFDKKHYKHFPFEEFNKI